MELNDNSPRTYRARASATWLRVLMVLIAICIIGNIIGVSRYKWVEAHSSAPKGSELNFPISQVKAKIKDIYTDKEQSALVVRIELPSTSKLPVKGTDYRVLVGSKSIKGQSEMDVLFGRISTDGDMYLVIPKPTNDVYSIFIDNLTSYRSAGTEYKDKGTSQRDISSYSKKISNYKYEGENSAVYKNEAENDAIGFRLTLNPAFDKEEFQPTVLDGTLFKDNKFNFKRFYEEAYKKRIVDDLKARHENINTEYQDVKAELDRVEETVKENGEDLEAKKRQEDLTDKLDEIEQRKREIATEITNEQRADLTEEAFKDINTKAYVIDKEVED
ncbi:hypothetical protein MTQ93_09600 [Staphylococcus agnetis]|uniref:hypothetical protein n=1 Tax=Staphylococcus agnetis TaxID=985762 RepID=UPI00208EEDA2|nr:hypothetical protein [Staphylococcus agnetis]MCO4346298.1 hypothetical protein [Staphylococcus agnetis]MCO4360626.1 hypothetical protein [Staphylococcus agnetis]